MSVVLDASALLAYLQREAGADVVKAALGEALISTVNWTEVVQKAAAAADEIEAIREDIQSLGLVIQPFSTAQAETAGRLRQSTAALGLSLADRACLALGIDTQSPVYTADRIWREIVLDGVDVVVIRGAL